MADNRSQTMHKRYEPIKMYKGLIGNKYNLLTIVDILPDRTATGRAPCVVRCDCVDGGHRQRVALLKEVTSGKLKSCGMCGYKLSRITSDISGQKFGELEVIRKTDRRDSAESVLWECKCSCGRTTVVSGCSLRSGHTKSCGICDYREKQRLAVVKVWDTPDEHRLSEVVLDGMIQRCTNPNDAGYANYGGRGISVCDEWKNDRKSFVNWALSSGYRKGLSIDRIDPNGNYCPENCVFATSKEQCNNERRNRVITIGSQSGTIAEWADLLGVDYNSIYGHYRFGGEHGFITRVLEIANSKGICV